MVALEPINELKQANPNCDISLKDSNFEFNLRNSSQKSKIMSTSSPNRDASIRRRKTRRHYDIIIFAASGCVGQFLVEELALVVDKHYPSSLAQVNENEVLSRRQSVPSSKNNGGGIRWAIAGRSAVRLNETLGCAELSTGIRGLSQNVPIILADLNKHDSLINMCQQTELVINCAGPYSVYGGELLIKACIDSQTNYLDLSHEINFNELMRQNYSDKAKQAGVFILQGCGFQSMSSELGLNFTKQIADGQIDQVKIILNLNNCKATSRLFQSKETITKSRGSIGIITPSMWQSLLVDKSHHDGTNKALTYDNNAKLASNQTNRAQQTDDDTIYFKQRTNRHLERKDTQILVRDIMQFRNRNTLSFFWPPILLVQNSIIKLFSLITFGRVQSLSVKESSAAQATGYIWPIDCLTSDESQLIRSEMSNYELRRPDLVDTPNGSWRPIQCSNFITFKSFIELCFFCIWLFIFQKLVKFSLARKLMSTFSSLFTLNYVASMRATSASANSSIPNNDQRPMLDRSSLSHIKFSQTFLAYGLPSDDSGDPLEKRDKNIRREREQLLVSRIVGPEPNHVATATYAIQAAITMLLERDHLPRSTEGQLGGVLTPGVAFAETNIIYQLRKRNIKFEVLKKA